MFEEQKGAISVLVEPVITTAESVFQARIDGRGFKYATIDVIVGSQHTSGGNFSVLKLTDCDTTSSSSFSGIVAFTGGTSVVAGSTGFTIPSQSNRGILAEFQVDLRKRKRYLMLDLTAAATTYYRGVSVIAKMTKEEQSKDNTTTKTLATLEYTSATNANKVGVLVQG